MLYFMFLRGISTLQEVSLYHYFFFIFFFSVNLKMYWQNLRAPTVSTVSGNSPTPVSTYGRAFATRLQHSSTVSV